MPSAKRRPVSEPERKFAVSHRAATLREIARLAGVHPSTVSLALRQRREIPPATCKRIQAIARRIGYRRDPLLDAFNSHRLQGRERRAPQLIAFVADFESRAALDASPQHAALWRGARAAADIQHCQLELCLLAPGRMTWRRLDAVLRARGIENVLVAALDASLSPSDMDWGHYRAVKIDSPQLEAPRYTVTADLRQAGRLALQQARKLGYCRVGLAIEPGGYDPFRSGFLYEQAGLSPATRVPPFDLPIGAASAAARGWLELYGIDAVITDRLGFGRALEAMGGSVSERIGWALLDPCGAPSEVAGVVIDHERKGMLAVEQIVNLIRGDQVGLPEAAASTLVPVHWRHGDSLRAAALGAR